MIIEIGIVAGEIWQQLDSVGKTTIDELATKLGKPKEHILMSVGWLAREGHVSLGSAADGYPVSLVGEKKE